MFPVTITISNHDQLHAVLAALSPPLPTGPAPRGNAPTKAAKAPAPPTAKEVVDAASGSGGESERSTQPLEAGNAPRDAGTAKADTVHTAPAGDAPTYQATADAITRLARAKGRDAAVAVLGEFGAARLPDVKPEQFAAIVAACEKAGG